MGCRIACGLLAHLLVACAAEQAPDSGRSGPAAPPPVTVAPDGHSSRDALDWPGTYEGVLACTGCPATFVRLTLAAGGGFSLDRRALAPSAVVTNVEGRFDWQPDGRAIVLDGAGDGMRFQVGEGRLVLLAADPPRPDATSDLDVLSQLATTAPAPGLAAVLQDHRWTLRLATDAGNRPWAALAADGVPPFELAFADGRIRIVGGCNGLVGGYRIDAGDRLVLQGLAATQMACAPALMAADAAMADALTGPLEAVVARGVAPQLALLTNAGQMLVFSGELTPGARFGPPTTVFLEVAPQRLPCEQPAAVDGLCLQVREITFDEQGLRIGTPGAFRPFTGSIEGYEHETGTRAVLRIHRYQPPVGTGDAVHVLDLVVETEAASG